MLKGGDPLHHPTAVNALPKFLPLPSLLAQKTTRRGSLALNGVHVRRIPSAAG